MKQNPNLKPGSIHVSDSITVGSELVELVFQLPFLENLIWFEYSLFTRLSLKTNIIYDNSYVMKNEDLNMVCIMFKFRVFFFTITLFAELCVRVAFYLRNLEDICMTHHVTKSRPIELA